jgi:hypothetical protein
MAPTIAARRSLLWEALAVGVVRLWHSCALRSSCRSLAKNPLLFLRLWHSCAPRCCGSSRCLYRSCRSLSSLFLLPVEPASRSVGGYCFPVVLGSRSLSRSYLVAPTIVLAISLAVRTSLWWRRKRGDRFQLTPVVHVVWWCCVAALALLCSPRLLSVVRCCR